MRIASLLAAIGFFTKCLTLAQGSPILQYEFNKAGSVQTSSGSSSLALTQLNYSGAATDYIGEAPVKRAGAVNNTVLNFTSTNVDTGLVSPNTSKGAVQASINDANAAFLRGGLGSFTISAWVCNAYAPVGTSSERRIFSLRNSNAGIIDFRLNNPGGGASNILTLSLTGTEGTLLFTATSVPVPANSNSWYFISVSYDAETGEIVFFTGEEGGTLKTASMSNTNANGINMLLQNATVLSVGNYGYNHDRRLDGYLSDLRFYGEALSVEKIGEIYAIPEPGLSMLLSAGVLFAWIRLRKQSAR